MIDCGPAATYKMTKLGLSPTSINHLFFTHHHFDHNADLPCFVLTRWDQSIGNETELAIKGPPPTKTLVDELFDLETGAYRHDLIARVNSPTSQKVHTLRGGSLPRKPLQLAAVDVNAGFETSGPDWQISSSEAHHVEPYLTSIAYRLETQSGSIVFAGDTEPCDEVVDLARGADVLVSMCWDRQSLMEEDESRGQCGTTGAGVFAHKAGVKTLILTHIGPRLSSPGVLEAGIVDATAHFEGTVIVAEELMTVELRDGYATATSPTL
jgi:ribonuclease BN (tRNA processing enzyme)